MLKADLDFYTGTSGSYDPTDNPHANEGQEVLFVDGENSIPVQKMNSTTPGGICNPIITYQDISPAPSVQNPIDGRLSDRLPLPTKTKEECAWTLFNQSPMHYPGDGRVY